MRALSAARSNGSSDCVNATVSKKFVSTVRLSVSMPTELAGPSSRSQTPALLTSPSRCPNSPSICLARAEPLSIALFRFAGTKRTLRPSPRSFLAAS